MKKLAISLSTILFSAHVYATSTLRVPVFIEGNPTPIPASEINKELAAVGAKLLPEYIEFNSGEKAYEKARAYHQVIGDTLKALGEKYEYVGLSAGLVPGENDTAQNFTCYKGQASEVVDIVSGLTDSIYSDQMQIWGYKNKNTTQYMFTEQDDEQNEEVKDLLNSESALWKNWDAKSSDLLILSAVGDSGDDVQESLIRVCK